MTNIYKSSSYSRCKMSQSNPCTVQPAIVPRSGRAQNSEPGAMTRPLLVMETCLSLELANHIKLWAVRLPETAL